MGVLSGEGGGVLATRVATGALVEPVFVVVVVAGHVAFAAFDPAVTEDPADEALEKLDGEDPEPVADFVTEHGGPWGERMRGVLGTGISPSR